MLIHTPNKHEFAFFFDLLSPLLYGKTPGAQILVDDELLYHRIINVLRLSEGELFILFDAAVHSRLQLLQTQGKKRLICLIIESSVNSKLTPSITFVLPLLKRDDLEAALYSLVEIGINSIQLLTTDKTQKQQITEKDTARMHKIMLAAAEQSKHFAVPTLHTPISLEKLLLIAKDSSATHLYYDHQGSPFFDVMQTVRKENPFELMVMVGPEGDLTPPEKEMVKAAGFIFCALTPTILRACQAVAVGAGALRAAIK
jgi:16S rRNA (uracil1498-N3)-methyltransferase